MVNHEIHKKQILNKSFNAIYGLISPEIPHHQACQMWEYIELFFDNIEAKILNENEPRHYQAIIYDILKVFKARFDESLAFGIPLLDVLYEEILSEWLA